MMARVKKACGLYIIMLYTILDNSVVEELTVLW